MESRQLRDEPSNSPSLVRQQDLLRSERLPQLSEVCQ